MVRERTEDGFPAAPVSLDELLTGIARGLTSAQGELDRAARAAEDETVRPLWFVFERTTVDLELSTFVARGERLQCRTLDPLAVALRGHAQATGTKLRIEIAPVGAEILREE